MSEIMALHGPGRRLDGLPAFRRYTLPSGRRLRLERGLERLAALAREMVASYLEALDAETPDPDLEPSLGMREEYTGGRGAPKAFYDRAAGVCDDREGCGGARIGTAGDSDFEPALGAPEAATPHKVVRFTSRRKRQGLRVVTEDNLDQTSWSQGVGSEEEEPSLAIADSAAAGLDGRARFSWQVPLTVQDADLEESIDDGEKAFESDDEPDADGEPILGATERADQRRWGAEQEPGWWTDDSERNGDEGDYTQGSPDEFRPIYAPVLAWP